MSDSTVLCVNTFAAFIGVIPFMIILQIMFRKHKLPKRHQFGLYLYVLVICSILMSSDTPSLYQLNFFPSFNFIPFKGFADSSSHYIQSFIIYIPLGLLLPTLWKQFQPLWKTFSYILLFSILIEISQIFCLASTAVTDVTDVIMNMTGAINMFLRQIVRDRAVPLSLSLSSEQSLYADLLRAKAEREQGIEGISASQLLEDMDRIIGEAESGV